MNDEIVDLDVFVLLEGLFNRLVADTSVFVNDAQALCAIFMVLAFAMKAYGMLTGGRPLEPVALLRPFALAFVLFLWGDFVALMNVPGNIVREKAKTLLDERYVQVNAIQLERRDKMAEVARKLIEDSAELEQWGDTDDEGWLGWTGVDFDALFDQVKGYYIILMAKARWLIVETLELVVVSLFQACAYLIFFIQVVFGAVLVILGPFSFAFSVLPAFQDAYTSWIARYFSVTLYAGIGYLVMSMSMTLLQYALEKELLALDAILQDEVMFFNYVSGTGAAGLYYLTALLVGAVGLLCVPTISGWVVTTAGGGQAVSAASRGMKSIVKTFI